MDAVVETDEGSPLALVIALREAEPSDRQQYWDQLERHVASMDGSGPVGSRLHKRIRTQGADGCLLCYYEVLAYDRTGEIKGLARNVAEATLQLREIYDFTLRFDIARALIDEYVGRWPNARGLRIPIPLIGDLKGPVDAFRDRKGVDVQVVRRPGATTTFVVFCGLGHHFGTPLNIFHHCCLAMHEANVVYLRDLSGCLYLTGMKSFGSIEQTCAGLRKVFAELNTRKLVFMGSSAGVFGALYYASLLDANEVVVFGGPTSLDIGAAEPEKQLYGRVMERRDEGKAVWPDLREIYADGPRPVSLYFAGGNRVDRLQAENVADLPNMNIHPLDTSFHFVLDELRRQGLLDSIFADAARPL
jgi:hypothetical protein